MKLLLLCLLLVGCATDLPTYQPENNDEYIEQLIAQTDSQIKAETSRTYAYAGVALVLAGVAMLAFTPKITSGLIVTASGAGLMAFPFILNSEWFDWVAGIFVSFILIDGLIFLCKFQINKNKSDSSTEHTDK
jgi:hypothetical protein